MQIDRSQPKWMMKKDRDVFCLIHLYPPHHNLSMQYDLDLRLGCFTCGGRKSTSENDCLHYYCTTCSVEFHNGCHQRPRKITHPYHLQHPLTLFYQNLEAGIISNIIPDFNPCESDTSDQEKTVLFVDIIQSKSDILFHKCTWCGKDLKGDWFFYRCLVCSFCLDLSCAETVPPLTIANPKSHHHSLLFLPRPVLVPCDACGLVNALEPSYACFQCNYMVHQNCIDLPRVIKITRHLHRLSHTPCISPEIISSCRVCYKKVDIKYGQYSCNHKDCSYVAHSKCATHENVWDGRELEWETEEADETEDDVASFRKLGDDFIKHFGHKHRLKLKKHDGVRDTEKQCRACIFPIVSPQFYHCKKCNYSLHEVCAGLSRKLDHALHNHTLLLDPSPLNHYAYMYCSACFRASTGFRYRCSKKGCQSGVNFLLDVRCILVPECFTHKSHDHPVFISTSYSSRDEILCKGCKKRCSGPHLRCTLCEFALCYPCGTIPNELPYKYDKHPLTLSYGESAADDIYWCEVCEKQLDPREWFYTCHKCCITIHLGCIFGSSVFMKPRSIFDHRGGMVKVFRNDSNTRQFCYICNNRCTSSIYYEGYKRLRTWVFYNNRWTCRIVFCSLECVEPEMRKW